MMATISTAAEPSQGLFTEKVGPLPGGLAQAYEKFVQTAKTGDIGDLTALALPQSLSWSSEPRPQGKEEYGADLNLPFLKNHFQSRVELVRSEGSDCWLLRTATSALWFVRLPQGWKLYHYLDKPMM
jgi:hypothetical protein